MGKINKEWHLQNKMPSNASDQQRIAWHTEHVLHCSCAPIPKGVQALMEKKPSQSPRKS